MRQNPAAIDAFPQKKVVGKSVSFVPAKLLGDEMVNPAAAQILGQVPAEAETIRKPEYAWREAEFAVEKFFSIEKLSDDGFRGNEVCVKLHPGSTLNLPATSIDLFFGFFIKSGMILFNPLIELSLGGSENIIWIALQKPERVGKSTRTFAMAFAQRPQPGQIQMCLTHAESGERAGMSGFI